MIILDTNVLSELSRAEFDSAVMVWISNYPLADLFTTAISVAEIRYGIGLVPDGRRKRLLAEAASKMFTRRFHGRILAFDPPAADVYAEIRNGRRQKGRPMSPLDAQIAAITAVNGASLATRNVKDFEGCGIVLINPREA